MKLRYSTTSPYVRKVRIAVLELNISPSFEEVPTNPWDADTDLADFNPLGKVPALVLEDGRVLFDSPVICEYLDAHFAPGRLFPKQAPARLDALRLQAAADGGLDASILRLLEGRRPEEYRWSQWVERQSAVMGRTLDWLEANVGLVKGPFNIGAVSVVALLGYLDFRYADEDWRPAHPKLAQWFEEASNRPSVQKTVPQE